MNLSYMRGVHTILVTPFNSDYSLNIEGHRRNVEFAAKSSAHALVCLGTQGEFHSLNTEEQKQIMKATVEQNAGRKPIICGTAHSSTLEAQELTRYAKEMGADAVLMTPPYYSQVTWKGVYDHFARIASKVDLPIVLYNAPERAGFNLTPEHLAKLSEIDQIVAVKQASRNIMEIEETISQVGDKLAVFGGSEAMMWPVMALGAVGSSSTAASFMPQYFVDIYEAAINGEYERGQDLFMKLAPFRVLSKKLGHAGVVKAAMDIVGLAGGPMRPPLVTPKREDLVELDKILADLGQK
ncbi:4-hydroxy-tetrahydrodipicolinate synthase [Ensifer adhaerens]|uniref:4-hydroxy-tetrahydrodipicolinate synthase n=1 Tax=Ensifer adhaerens TaxID=106592 RepID=A0A9Q8YJ31_ENSAD|nr:4-hydroxy-tetrahydrodipicolinate synthase [Ensifer adhaerens]USJ28409.1 4-hydroxy-tetrahydrodipicolinate synthase [Ensifer adhaerens]